MAVFQWWMGRCTEMTYLCLHIYLVFFKDWHYLYIVHLSLVYADVSMNTRIVLGISRRNYVALIYLFSYQTLNMNAKLNE